MLVEPLSLEFSSPLSVELAGLAVLSTRESDNVDVLPTATISVLGAAVDSIVEVIVCVETVWIVMVELETVRVAGQDVNVV